MTPDVLTPLETHPESAWLIDVVPLAITVAAILLVALFLRGRLRTALDGYLRTRFAQPGQELVDASLVFHPAIITAEQVLVICMAGSVAILLVLSRIAPLFLAIVLTGPVLLLLVWLVLWSQERRYVAAIDKALPSAVGRLATQLRTQQALAPAMEKVIADMPPGHPLRQEWSWCLRSLGTPLQSGYLATTDVIAGALHIQTPSERHRTFLGHLEIAANQPQEAQAHRVGAAYDALIAAQRRSSTALTELSNMRNTGYVLFGVTVLITVYMVLVQRERFERAYSGPLGMLVGAIVIVAMLAPVIGGQLLAQVEDFDY